MIGKDEGEDNSGENSWRTERSRTVQSSPTGAGTVSKQPPRTSLRRLVLCCAYEFDKRKKKTGEGSGILTLTIPSVKNNVNSNRTSEARISLPCPRSYTNTSIE